MSSKQCMQDYQPGYACSRTLAMHTHNLNTGKAVPLLPSLFQSMCVLSLTQALLGAGSDNMYCSTTTVVQQSSLSAVHLKLFHLPTQTAP